jgi:hypothetical protein
MIEVISEDLIGLFLKMNKTAIPLDIVLMELGNTHQMEDIKQAIEQAIDDFKIDKVLDYPDDEWNLSSGRPLWHLLILTPDDADRLRNLDKVDFALLRLLKSQTTPKQEGEMKSEDARTILREQGFTDDDLQSLWVEDLVDHHYEFKDEKSIEWCRLIPENEKTEEYKKTMEEIQEEFARKEEFRMYITDTHDLAHGILKAVRASPEGISKIDIIKQLFRSDPDYLKDAFEIATEENEILSIVLDNGEEGFRINPDFHKENY